jgi:hypothetical protein
VKPVAPSRVASVLLAAGVATFATISLRAPEGANHPEVLAFAALNQSPQNVPKAVRLYLSALRGDLANPYRWADLGAAYQTGNDVPKARDCCRRALELSGDRGDIVKFLFSEFLNKSRSPIKEWRTKRLTSPHRGFKPKRLARNRHVDPGTV